jgi:outer membrane protein TolC
MMRSTLKTLVWIAALNILAIEKPSYALDLSSIIKASESEDAQIINGLESIINTDQRLIELKKWIKPNISIGYNLAKNHSHLRGIPGIDPNTSIHTSNSINFNISQSLYDPFRKSNIQEASAQLNYEATQLSVTQNDNVIRILQLIFDIAMSGDIIDLQQKEVDNIKHLLNKIQSDPKARSEFINYEIRLIQAQANVSQAIASLRQNSRELAKLTGGKLANVKFNAKIKADLQNILITDSLELLLSKLDMHNLELMQQAQNLKLAEIRANRFDRENYPSVSFGINSSVSAGAPGYSSLLAGSSAASIQINVPLSNGGESKSIRTEALSVLSKASNDLQITKKSVQSRLSDLFFELSNNLEQIKLHKKILDNQLKIKDLSKNENSDDDSGIQLSAAMLEAESSIINTRQSIIRFERDAIVAWVKLKGMTSEIDSSELLSLSKLLIAQ